MPLPEGPPPRPPQAHFFTPKGQVPHGKVYANADFRPPADRPVAPEPDVLGPRIVVDIKAGAYRDLDIRDIAKRLQQRHGKCAAFSFVDPKKGTVNRIWCSAG